MAPSIVGTPGTVAEDAASVAAFPHTYTPGLPTGYLTGDTILCAFAGRSSAMVVTTPSGWTPLLNVATTNGRLALFARAADGTETAPALSVSGGTTGTTGSGGIAQCFAARGLAAPASLVHVLGASNDQVASTTLAAAGASITTTIDQCLVLSLSVRLDNAGTWTKPSFATAMVLSYGSASGNDEALAVSYLVKSPAGAVTTSTYSLAGASSFASSGIMVALAPAPPVATLSSTGATKVSAIAGKDQAPLTITADRAFVEYELRVVPAAGSPQTAGTRVETAVVASTSSLAVTVTEAELLAAAGGNGTFLVKAFVKDASGLWST